MTLRLVIALTVLAHVAFVGSRVTVSLHAIALGATPLTVGVLMSLYAALPMLLAVHAGRRIDRGGAAGPLLAGLLAVAAGVLLPFAWPSLAALFVAATAIGTGFLFVHLALNNVAGALAAPEQRAASFAWLALGFSTGGFFGPLVAGFAIDGFGHRLAFLVLAVFPLFAAGILWQRRRRVPALARRVREWPMVVAAMTVAGAAYALFPLAESVAPLMALSFVLGLGLGCAQPFIMTLLYAASPPGRQGEVIGIRTTMLSGSHTVLPLAMGALGAALGMAPVFWSMAAALRGGG